MTIMATRDVEVYNNKISNNNTISIGIVSYELMAAMSEKPDKQPGNSSAKGVDENFQTDERYNPYPGRVFVHDNEYSNNSLIPKMDNDFGKLFMLKFGLDRPHVVWDGIQAPDYLLASGEINPDYRICVQEAGIKTAILDAAHMFEGLESNPASLNCSL